MEELKSLIGQRILFFDGAMGTMFNENSVELNIQKPSLIQKMHCKYIETGTDIITTNTFGINEIRYKNWKELITAAINNAKEAVKISNKKNYIALDIGPTAKILKPFGDLEFEDAVNLFSSVIQCGVENGVDLILIETMYDLYETKAAVVAAKENCNLPIFVSLTFKDTGKTINGSDIDTMVTLLEGLGVTALGINCGVGPFEALKLTREIANLTSIPFFVQPNAGMPVIENNKVIYKVTPEEFSDTMVQICKEGASLIGGCCGTTPEYIRCTIEKCNHIAPNKISQKNFTAMSSYSKTVYLRNTPIIIGERINTSNRDDLTNAIKNSNFDFLCDEAIEQVESGADVIDVNIWCDNSNEAIQMPEAVKAIQEVLNVPLSLDTLSIEAIENSLRIYNGKPMINSVNGCRENMKKLFPIAKKYGALVVCLTIDEDGIPKTSEKRLEIARNILSTAQAYGLRKCDLIFDTLSLAAISSEDEALECIRTLKLIKDELGVKTILAISNISYGFKKRNYLNNVFISIALYSGLDACILNPLKADLMKTFYSALYLLGKDVDLDKII